MENLNIGFWIVLNHDYEAVTLVVLSFRILWYGWRTDIHPSPFKAGHVELIPTKLPSEAWSEMETKTPLSAILYEVLQFVDRLLSLLYLKE